MTSSISLQHGARSCCGSLISRSSTASKIERSGRWKVAINKAFPHQRRRWAIPQRGNRSNPSDIEMNCRSSSLATLILPVCSSSIIPSNPLVRDLTILFARSNGNPKDPQTASNLWRCCDESLESRSSQTSLRRDSTMKLSKQSTDDCSPP